MCNLLGDQTLDGSNVSVPSGQVRVGLSRGTFSQSIEDRLVSFGGFDTIKRRWDTIRVFFKSCIKLKYLPLNVGNVLKVVIEDLIGQRSFKSERHVVSKFNEKERKKKFSNYYSIPFVCGKKIRKKKKTFLSRKERTINSNLKFHKPLLWITNDQPFKLLFSSTFNIYDPSQDEYVLIVFACIELL